MAGTYMCVCVCVCIYGVGGRERQRERLALQRLWKNTLQKLSTLMSAQ